MRAPAVSITSTAVLCAEYKGAERGAVRGLVLFFVSGRQTYRPRFSSGLLDCTLYHFSFLILNR